MHLDAPVKRNPGIGLTPLIDVVFILLVFFMLATRFTVLQEAPLQLSATGAAGAEEEVVRMEVDSREHIAVGQRVLTFAELPGWLAEQSGRRLVVIPGPDVSLQTTVDVIAAIEASGHEALDVALLDGS